MRHWWLDLFAAVERAAMGAGLLAAVALAADDYGMSLDQKEVAPGVRLEGISLGGLEGTGLEERVARAEARSLERSIELRAGPVAVTRSAASLGADPVPGAALETARAVGRSGDMLTNLRARVAARRGGVDLPVVHRFDETRALAALQGLGPKVDRPSLPTRLDLAARRVVPAELGAALLPYDSLSPVALGLASGATAVELVTATKPPVEDSLGKIAKQIDISIVLGSFGTPYKTDPSAADRTHNLSVGAASLDGVVLLPGETFSFNEAVGPRDAENGYRYAPGITAGELVDVLGGGICQVSSSLFGAAFFAGLELERSRPHSRPSSYVDMGLDSTVVYPTIDMRFKNTFDFPVVLHMTVQQGTVRAEILGPRRPFQVVFERELVEVTPFGTVYREDPSLRVGTETVGQRGMRGFSLKRTRRLLQGGEEVRVESWDLNYPPTTEIRRRGISPTGEIPKSRPRPTLRDPSKDLRVVQ